MGDHAKAGWAKNSPPPLLRADTAQHFGAKFGLRSKSDDTKLFRYQERNISGAQHFTAISSDATMLMRRFLRSNVIYFGN